MSTVLIDNHLKVGDLLLIPSSGRESWNGIIYKEDIHNYYIYWTSTVGSSWDETWDKRIPDDVLHLKQWKKNAEREITKRD